MGVNELLALDFEDPTRHDSGTHCEQTRGAKTSERDGKPPFLIVRIKLLQGHIPLSTVGCKSVMQDIDSTQPGPVTWFPYSA